MYSYIKQQSSTMQNGDHFRTNLIWCNFLISYIVKKSYFHLKGRPKNLTSWVDCQENHKNTLLLLASHVTDI